MHALSSLVTRVVSIGSFKNKPGSNSDFLFHFYIYPSDLQDNVRGAIFMAISSSYPPASDLRYKALITLLQITLYFKFSITN